MHRRIGADVLPLDTELEKTIRNLKKEKATVEASIMTNQGEANQNIQWLQLIDLIRDRGQLKTFGDQLSENNIQL